MSSSLPVVSMFSYSLMQSFWLLRVFAICFAVSFALPNMQPQRPTFCGFYQAARQVKGRPMCSFTRHSCPHSLHACQLCGKSGHGAEDCRTRAQPQMTPPAEQPPPPPTPEPSRYAVFVPGFGCKGEGKVANYGVAIALPSVATEEDLPPGLQQPGSSSSAQGVEAPPEAPLIPTPIPATTQEVEEWMSSSFKPLTNISTNFPPEVGDSVLWRGVKTGPHGQPSTKCEYFNAKVRHTAVDEDHEFWFYVD